MRRLGFAWAGLTQALRGEHSFRFQAVAALGALALLLWFRPPPLWWAVVILATVLVLAAELINTALEALADHLHPDEHPRIRIVKDCAAAAVLVASIGALGVAAAFVYSLLA